MAKQINPSGIMLYKIVKDFEERKRTVFFVDELKYICNQVLENTNKVCDEKFEILQTEDANLDLLKICEISHYSCILNKEKYFNGGRDFAIEKIKKMPKAIFEETANFVDGIQKQRKKSNTTYVEVHYPDGDVYVSGLCHDCRKIVIEDLKKDELSK